MFYHLALRMQQSISWLSFFDSLLIRSLIACCSALSISLMAGSWFIKNSQLFRSKVREYTPENHKIKNYTPTMGGLFVIVTIVINAFFWCNLCTPAVLIFLFCLVSFGALGFWDDWHKINKSKGISAAQKFGLQWLIAGITAWLMVQHAHTSMNVFVPLLKSTPFDISWLFIPWAMFIIVACSNAVNLTDGLDGLATGSLIPNFILFALFNGIVGSYAYAQRYNLPVTHSGELAIIGSITIGALFGFLWYNKYPARVFMGDVGSLALGSGLATMALLAKQELLLIIAGGIFVLETSSVILQVASYRIRGKRLFKMAPIHHHFELLGWKEKTITIRFSIASLILCVVAALILLV